MSRFGSQEQRTLGMLQVIPFTERTVETSGTGVNRTQRVSVGATGPRRASSPISFRPELSWSNPPDLHHDYCMSNYGLLGCHGAVGHDLESKADKSLSIILTVRS